MRTKRTVSTAAIFRSTRPGPDDWERLGNRHVNVAAPPRLQPHHRTVAALAVRYAPAQGTMLDLGCGLGQVAKVVRAANPEISIYIADAYRQCLDLTMQEVRVAGAYLTAESHLALPQAGLEFDVVILSHVLEHMLDPIAAVRQALEVTRPGGHCILAVPNPARPGVLLGNAFQRHYVNRGHVVAWDRSHWMNFLEGILELDVVEYASDCVHVFPGRLKDRLSALERFEVWLARALPWWSFSHIAVVRRQAWTGA